MQPVLERLKQYYTDWGECSHEKLGAIYTEDIVFEDPIERISGIDQLNAYFLQSQRGLNYCRFVFHDEIVTDSQATLMWTMNYSHRKLNRGENLAMTGSSWIQYSDKVTYQRDFYDMTQMVFDHVPLLGKVTGYLKNRMRVRKM